MNSDAHLYAKVTNEIKQQIHGGKYMNGDKLPSERKLCKEFGVSRITIRQALYQLEELKIIDRKQGLGTFIRPFEYGQLSEIFSRFTERIKDNGEKPGTKMLDMEHIKADEYIQKKIGLPIDAPLYKLSRLRLANERPLLLEYSYIPYLIAPELDKYNFGKVSLYHILEQEYSVEIDQAFETLKPAILNGKDASLLKKGESTVAMNLERFVYSDSQVIEFTNSLVVDDKYQYTVDLI